jgi:hypothetical protein
MYFTYTIEGFALSSSNKEYQQSLTINHKKCAHPFNKFCVQKQQQEVCVFVHNQQQQQVWCVCNQQREVVRAQLTTSTTCAQSINNK